MRRLLTAATIAATATLAIAGCASGTTPSGDGSASTELQTVQVSAPPSFNALTLHVAQEEGYFAEVGLNIEITPTVGAEAVPQLLGGGLQFMLADMVTLVRTKAEGLPLVIAAPNVLLDSPGKTAYTNILMRAADAGKYSTAADISGHTFGIPTIGSQPWLDVRTLVEEAGGDPDSIQFVEVPNPLQALRQGQVDFVTAPEPTGTAGVLEGDVAFLVPITQETLGGVIGYPYLTTQTLVDSDPDLVEAFRSAVIKANVFINAHPDEARAVAATYIDVPEDVLNASTLPKLGEAMPTEKELQATIDRIVGAGIIEADVAPTPADLLPRQ